MIILKPGTLPTTRRLLLLALSLSLRICLVFSSSRSLSLDRGCTWNLFKKILFSAWFSRYQFQNMWRYPVGSWSFVGSVYEIFHINNFTFIPHGLLRTHKWPAANVSGFIAQLVRGSTDIARSRDLNPVEVLWFSGFYIRHCINYVHNCEDHSLLDFAAAVQYMKYSTYITSQTIFCFNSQTTYSWNSFAKKQNEWYMA